MILRLKTFFSTVLLGIAAGIAYGITHDQITARLSVEYFTIGHPILIDTQSPTILGLLWGVVATWWAGAILGALLGLAATLGPWPVRSAGSLRRPIFGLLCFMAAGALLRGFWGHHLGAGGDFELSSTMIDRIYPADPAVYQGVWFAHRASYAFAGAGGLLLSLWVFIRRITHPKSEA